MSALRTVPVYLKPLSFPDCPQGRYVVPSLTGTRNKLSLIVPTYQEAGNIEQFLVDLCAVLDRELPLQYEILVIDDDSPDGTWRRVAHSMGRYPAIRMIRRSGERGLASAVVRGYQVATGEILGTINADFQHPPQTLAGMIRSCREADVVVASRFCAGGGTGDWPQDRLMMSRAAFQAGKLMLPEVFAGLTDPLSGFYLFRRTVIEGIELFPTGFKTLIEILARGRARNITECPYTMNARRNGRSKATLESSLSFLLQLRRLQIISPTSDVA
jgi:dolichol-phosphate mannosyltransferase